MKDNCGLILKGLSYFVWIIGFVLLTRNVGCVAEVPTPGNPGEKCVPGQNGFLDTESLDMILNWMPDEFKNPDDICVTYLGSGSSLCRDRYESNYSEICGGIFCRDPILDTCTRVSAKDGVSCGNQKWCFNGECRYSNQALPKPESCPFGDSRTFFSDGQSCQEAVSRDRRVCYDVSVEQNCCKSCAAVSMNRQGCQYGDRTGGCRETDCLMMTVDQMRMCCQTCGFYIEIVPTQGPSTSKTPSPTTQSPSKTTSRTSQKTPSPTETSITGQTTKTETSITGQTTKVTKQTTRISGQTTQASESQQTTAATATETTAATAAETTPTTTTRISGSPQTTTETSSQEKTSKQTSDTSQQTNTEPLTATPGTTFSNQRTTSNIQLTETTSQEQTTTNNNFGASDTQQANQNAVTIGTSVGVSAVVVVIVVVVVVYVIRRKVALVRSALPNPDTASVGGDSFSALTADMGATSTTWYPNYRTSSTMD